MRTSNRGKKTGRQICGAETNVDRVIEGELGQVNVMEAQVPHGHNANIDFVKLHMVDLPTSIIY